MKNSHNLPDDPDSLDEEITDEGTEVDAAATTLFSDGSTFDYENGYQSNGAPVATRDRKENPTILKSHEIFTSARVIGTLGVLILVSLIMGMAFTIVSVMQSANNWKVLKAGVDDSGQAEVVQSTSPNSLIVKRSDGSVFKCDVSMVNSSGESRGLVFCAPGSPSTFSIPLPHDTNNVFYVAPIKDN